MLSEVTFGQYYPSDSFVHKLDPRAKILLLIAYIVMIFVAQNFFGLILALLFLAVAVAVSGVPFTSILKSIKAIIFLVVFTAVLNILFYSPKAGDTHLFWIIYAEGLFSAGFLAVRLISLVMGSSLLTLRNRLDIIFSARNAFTMRKPPSVSSIWDIVSPNFD